MRSDFDGSATVEISYFTSGITWAADYVCISDPGETDMSFEGFVRITNNSGEDYSNAQMRLVVGTINLVERVRDLAQRGVISKSDFNDYRQGRKKAGDMPASARRELAAGLARDMDRISSNEKEIIKEGLSEYFIYTIEGTETVKNSWSKRMRLFAGERTPLRIQYRYRPAEYGHQLVRMFLLRNDEESNRLDQEFLTVSVISKSDFNDYRQGRKKAGDMPASARRELAAGLARDMDRISSNEKEIIKEGLSEYFIYTIEGTETVKNSWSKRMRLFAGERTPLRIQYRYRPAEYGHQLVRMFLLRNDEESNLGSTPLPDGIVRLYRDNGRDGLSYLVQHFTKYVPIGQEIELNLGVDPEVIHERVRLQSWRDDFWFHDTNRRRARAWSGFATSPRGG